MAYTEKICKGCGATFMGHKRMEYCEACRKHRNHTEDKPSWTEGICAKCGTAFTKASPNQKFCPECGIINKRQVRTRVNDKYNKSAYDRFEFRVPKGGKNRIISHAEKQGESVNQFITRAVDNQIELDNSKE